MVVWLLSVVVGRVGVVVVVVVVVGCCTHPPAVACIVCVVAVAVGTRGEPEGLRQAGAAANMLGAEIGAVALLHRCQRYQQSLVWCGVVWGGVGWGGVGWGGVGWGGVGTAHTFLVRLMVLHVCLHDLRVMGTSLDFKPYSTATQQ
mgnify:CR=1 FL=1